MWNETILVLWSGGPVEAVIEWHSAGIAMGFLFAALVGSVLAIVLSRDTSPRRKPARLRPLRRAPRPAAAGDAIRAAFLASR
jgi:hypothetical protein